jgi:hypothetical protein
MTKTQIATLVLLAIYLIWEVFVQVWSGTAEGQILRFDLWIIYPVFVMLAIRSVYQIMKKKW